MLRSRAGYRSARPITPDHHIRLATHGRSIQKCQKRQLPKERSDLAMASSADRKAFSFRRCDQTPRNAPAILGEGQDHLKRLTAGLAEAGESRRSASATYAHRSLMERLRSGF
jgi:hypothetical protein